jgi:hypothetical protein
MKGSVALMVAGLALSLGAWHCGEDPTGLSTQDVVALLKRGPAQSYAYSAFDASGAEVVRGVMLIVISDSSRVNGLWDLEETGGGAGMIGPQVGSGELEGTLEGTKIGVNLNPQYADNNVVLLGTLSATGFEGTWQYVGFPGVLNTGTFRAAKAR